MLERVSESLGSSAIRYSQGNWMEERGVRSKSGPCARQCNEVVGVAEQSRASLIDSHSSHPQLREDVGVADSGAYQAGD